MVWTQSYLELGRKFNHGNAQLNYLYWSAPEVGWIKLNTDVAVSKSGASMGGSLRDDHANWLWGFHLSLGSDSMFKIEARALLEGLLLAWDKGFKKIIVECDNSLLVDLLSSVEGLIVVWLRFGCCIKFFIVNGRSVYVKFQGTSIV